jgi:hypothetical protein
VPKVLQATSWPTGSIRVKAYLSALRRAVEGRQYRVTHRWSRGANRCSGAGLLVCTVAWRGRSVVDSCSSFRVRIVAGVRMAAKRSGGSRYMKVHVQSLRSNNALVTDACVAALRASYSAAQRGRYTAELERAA